MQHDTTTYSMIQQHTTMWSNGANFFFSTNVVGCCMKSWDRLTGALQRYVKCVIILRSENDVVKFLIIYRNAFFWLNHSPDVLCKTIKAGVWSACDAFRMKFDVKR